MLALSERQKRKDRPINFHSEFDVQNQKSVDNFLDDVDNMNLEEIEEFQDIKNSFIASKKVKVCPTPGEIRYNFI